jgi:hypothetical protein
MLTGTEGFLPSKSSSQMRTNQSAIFPVRLCRSNRVGDRYLMFFECFLDNRGEKIADRCHKIVLESRVCRNLQDIWIRPLRVGWYRFVPVFLKWRSWKYSVARSTISGGTTTLSRMLWKIVISWRVLFLRRWRQINTNAGPFFWSYPLIVRLLIKIKTFKPAGHSGSVP